nr:prolyl 4-hydroxylase alpha subunit 1 [Caenorhabditis elegans]
MRLALLVLATIGYAVADLFTSIADMQNLLETERNIPKILDKYIHDEEERLVQLKKLSEEYSKKNEISIENGLKDITNPINAFLLIKRKIFD